MADMTDVLGNIFNVPQPEYMSSLLGEDAANKLKERANTTGLINMAVGYLAQPKTMHYGSALPYLAKSYVAGQEGAQATYTNALNDWQTAQKVKEMQRQQQQQVLQDQAIAKIGETNPELGTALRAFPSAAPAVLEKLYSPVKPDSILGKLDPKDFTPESWNAFVNAGGDLKSTNLLRKAESPEKTFKVGDIQEYQVGDKKVTREYQGNGQWKQIGEGGAWKPTTVADINPQALTYAAEIYRKTGQMPALGQGSSQMRQAILGEAARLDASEGITPTQGAENIATTKATQSALSQLSKQATLVKSFEKTAVKNGDLALQISNQTDRTGIPIVNKWVQAGKKSITGDPQISAFNAANETFVNEYAKIMSGSMGNTPVSDAARQHAHDMLSTVQTKEQYQAVHNVLRQEMQNRITGLDQELTATRQSLGSGVSKNKPQESITTTPAKRSKEDILKQYGVHS